MVSWQLEAEGRHECYRHPTLSQRRVSVAGKTKRQRDASFFECRQDGALVSPLLNQPKSWGDRFFNQWIRHGEKDNLRVSLDERDVTAARRVKGFHVLHKIIVKNKMC